MNCRRVVFSRLGSRTVTLLVVGRRVLVFRLDGRRVALGVGAFIDFIESCGIPRRLAVSLTNVHVDLAFAAEVIVRIRVDPSFMVLTRSAGERRT